MGLRNKSNHPTEPFPRPLRARPLANQSQPTSSLENHERKASLPEVICVAIMGIGLIGFCLSSPSKARARPDSTERSVSSISDSKSKVHPDGALCVATEFIGNFDPRTHTFKVTPDCKDAIGRMLTIMVDGIVTETKIIDVTGTVAQVPRHPFQRFVLSRIGSGGVGINFITETSGEKNRNSSRVYKHCVLK